jgi:hypothetical protein
MIETLNMLAAVMAICAAGYIFARIHIRMRALAAGSLFAYGILRLHAPLAGLELIHVLTNISIIGCLVYFAIVANNFVELAANVVKVKSDRHVKDPQPITDFPPHNFVRKDEESNVSKR